MKRKLRRIVVDECAYQWTRSHGHETTADANRRCVEKVRVWAEGRKGDVLELRFEDSPSCQLLSGGWGGHDGGVQVDGTAHNLNLPSTIAALIRAAAGAHDWPTQTNTITILDGADVLRSRARSRES